MECLRYMDENKFETTFTLIWARYLYTRNSKYSYYSIYCDNYYEYIQELINEDYELFAKICDYFTFLGGKEELKDTSCFIKHAYMIYQDRDIKQKLKNYKNFEDLLKIYFVIREELDY